MAMPMVKPPDEMGAGMEDKDCPYLPIILLLMRKE